MLLALLLAACAAPAAQEWVEISQTHYRKPGDKLFYPSHETIENNRNNFYSAQEDIINEHGRYKPNINRPFKDEDDFENNSDNVAYPNRSIAEHKWHRDGDIYSHGNIKRLNNEAKIKGNITPEFSLDVFGEVTEETPELVTVTRNKIREQEAAPATIERVSNKGSVKRVQLTNTPVKSPTLPKVNPVRRNDVKQHGFPFIDSEVSDEFEIKPDIFANTQNDVAKNNGRRVFSSTRQTPFRKYERTTTDWPNTETTISFQKHPQTITKEHSIPTKNTRPRNKSTITNVPNNSTSKDVSVTEVNFTKDSYIEPYDSTEEYKNRFQDATTLNQIHKTEEIEEELKSKHNRNGNKVHQNESQKHNKPKSNGDTNGNTNENVTNEQIKLNTMENVMKFLKVVTDTISKNTRKGVNGKVKYLHELKDTLLSSIKERIDATWPDEGAARGRRSARSARAGRGHVEFPSSESSLMTISFLTFAVFLIKLVLQVIQTYKHKTMMVAPLVVATAGRKLRKT